MSGMAAGLRQVSADGHMTIAADMLPLARLLIQTAQAAFGPVLWSNGWGLGGVVSFVHAKEPSTRLIPAGKVAVISVSPEGLDDLDNGLFQIAHEVVHCLHLDGQDPEPSMLEEGSAVLHSLRCRAYADPTYAARRRCWHMTVPGGEHYAEALRSVERLLALNPEAIRTLRGQDPDWRAVTPARLRAVAPALTDEQAALLCERREMRPDAEGDIARAMMAGAGR